MREEFSNITACYTVWRWIYIFHMPLFVFISGYFSSKKDATSLKSSLWKLIEPLIIFHALGLTLEYFIKGNFSLNMLFSPWWLLWYLLSLIYWRLLLQVIPNRILNDKIFISITFAISILSGFLPINTFLAMSRTISFMPFFFLGYYMKGKNLYLPDKYKPLCLLFLLLMIVVASTPTSYLGNLGYAGQFGGIPGALRRILVFILAILMSIAFINVCPNKPWIAQQGRFTMQYYIYHGFTIPIVMLIANRLSIPMAFLTATIITLGIAAAIGLASRLPYFSKFTNPSLLLKK